MQESYGEGVASHTDPESCVQRRKVRHEALTGGRAGEVIEPRNENPVVRRAPRGADALAISGRPHGAGRHGETRPNPARSQSQRMYGNLTRGNREVPRESAAIAADHIGKSKDARR